MKIFIDSADVEEIRKAVSWGIVDGVTTNPSLAAKTGRNFKDSVLEICKMVSGPVSAEVVSTVKDEMVKEARELAKWAPNIAVKIPLTKDGIAATSVVSKEGVRVNQTLVFSSAQALLAAKAGAAFVSPFIGRLDDIGMDGMALIEEIVQIYDNYDFETEIIVASIRHPMHVVEAALLGADIATVPYPVLEKLFNHALTDKGLAAFLADWEKMPAELKKR
jgi:transaldolase